MEFDCESHVVRMGAYTTNDDGLLHGHQVVLECEGYDQKRYMLRDGTFKDDLLHHGIEFSYDFTVRTVRMVLEEAEQCSTFTGICVVITTFLVIFETGMVSKKVVWYF